MGELEVLCRQAAADLVARERDHGGASPAPVLPAAVVLPAAGRTRIVRLPELPDGDGQRFQVLAQVAEDEMRPAGVPCYGFVAEASTVEGDDVVVVVYGARRHHPRILAAPLVAGGLGEWTEAEELAREAMPFLAPLQQAADAAPPPDVMTPR